MKTIRKLCLSHKISVLIFRLIGIMLTSTGITATLVGSVGIQAAVLFVFGSVMRGMMWLMLRRVISSVIVGMWGSVSAGREMSHCGLEDHHRVGSLEDLLIIMVEAVDSSVTMALWPEEAHHQECSTKASIHLNSCKDTLEEAEEAMVEEVEDLITH